MKAIRALVLALVVASSMVAVPLSLASGYDADAHAAAAPSATADATEAAGGAASVHSAVAESAAAIRGGPVANPSAATATRAAATRQDDRPENATTEGTAGYVEGYWYDDELEVDDRENASLEEEELEAVVYRSMARAEVIRNLTFRSEVPVDVVSREEFQTDDEMFGEPNESGRLHQNLRFEALFMADRDTDATDEMSSLFGGSVGGYYLPTEDRIVVVSDNPETPEMNEVTLGHELVHALQDQHFDLTSYDKRTRDRANAIDGLIEGDASWVDTEYESRCGAEWSCVLPASQEPGGQDFNVGMFLTIFHPYSDGPSYVDHLRDEGGWEAVNAAYDEPPASSSEIIRLGEERVPADVEIEDRSADRWQELETSEGPNYSSFGEATMAAMLAYPTFESRGQFTIIPQNEVLNDDEFDPYDYDHEYTDGWAGDRLVKYVTDEESIDDSGYVWRTEWTSAEEADQFVDGYLQLLEYHDAESVEDRQNTFVIDDEYPGAYYVDHDGETVTIVRAPSVDELREIREGAAPEGEDTIGIDDGNETDDGDGDDREDGADGGDGDDDTDENETDDGSADGEGTPGFGVATALIALLVAALAAAHRRR